MAGTGEVAVGRRQSKAALESLCKQLNSWVWAVSEACLYLALGKPRWWGCRKRD